MGHSRIYEYIAFPVACIVIIPLIIFFIYNGVLLDWSTTAPLGCIILLIIVFFFVFGVVLFGIEPYLHDKYEYTFENYKYSIRKDTLISGEIRYYPLVSLAKYSTDQYIERKLNKDTGQIYYELTNFGSNKEQREYRQTDKTTVYYSSEERAKQVIEEYKVYWAEVLERNRKYTEECVENKRKNTVNSSEIINIE